MEIGCISGILLIVFGRSAMTSGLDVFAPFLFMLVIPIFAFGSGFISNHLKKYKYLGEISYSVYLNQYVLLLLIKHDLDVFELPITLILSIYLVTLLAYSHLTYQYIEKPLRIKGRYALSRIITVST
jgi:peptidoglycan/LPS O-acetylase OafA/YrhL